MMIRGNHLLAVVGFVLLVTATASAQPTANDATAHQDASWSSLESGDIVARGSTTPGGCHFDTVTVRLDGATSSPSVQFLDLRVDEECNLRVHDLGVSTTTTSDTTLLVGWNSQSDSNDSGSSTVTTMASSKSVTTNVIHYGSGGTSDHQTRKEQTIEWSYDGSSATMTNDYGSCWWKDGWVLDDCATTYRITSGSEVYRESIGEFHYDPLDVGDDLYHHTLTAMTWGNADGTHTCDYSVSGTIMDGVYMECIVN